MLATDQLLKRVVNTWLLVARTRARTVQTQAAQGGIKMILRAHFKIDYQKPIAYVYQV